MPALKILTELVGALLSSLLLAGITIAIANPIFGQSWDYWSVYWVWVAALAVGVVWFEVCNGEFDPFN